MKDVSGVKTKAMSSTRNDGRTISASFLLAHGVFVVIQKAYTTQKLLASLVMSANMLKMRIFSDKQVQRADGTAE